MAAPSATKMLESGEYDPFTLRLFLGETPQDEIDWIETLLTIDSEQGEVVQFRLFPQQKLMAENRTGRDLTVKGRQTRASSLILARNLRRMLAHGGLKCLTMTQDDQTTATFRARIKHHLKDLENKGFHVNIGLDNENELVFADTGSRYLWGSGEERVAGRAYTGHIVHLSEFAHWPPERTGELIGGIQPSVPGPPHGWIDIESTPSGAEGTFYDMIMSSRTYDPMSRWTTHFYSWWLEPRYRAGSILGDDVLYSEEEWENILQGFEPTPEEERLVEAHGLDVGQVIWRRVRKREQDKTDAPFLQEYPETLEGCFLTAGGSYFATPEGINHLEPYRNTIAPPKETVDKLPFRNGTVAFNGPNLYVWQRPQPGHPYVAWVDCAGGGLGEDSDYSAVVVMDAANKFIAARLAVKVAPQELAPMVVAVATWYNTALLGGERDAYGSVCLNKIQQLYYRNLWYWVEPGSALKIHQAPSEPWGHPTQIRNYILSALREAVFSGTFHTSDAWLVQQMGAFVWTKVAGREKLKAAGKKGYKDDLVMCAAGCVYISPLMAHRAQRDVGRPLEPEPIKENEVVVVGQHGLVLNRYVPKGNRGVMPWLR